MLGRCSSKGFCTLVEDKAIANGADSNSIRSEDMLVHSIEFLIAYRLNASKFRFQCAVLILLRTDDTHSISEGTGPVCNALHPNIERCEGSFFEKQMRM